MSGRPLQIGQVVVDVSVVELAVRDVVVIVVVGMQASHRAGQIFFHTSCLHSSSPMVSV